MLETASKGLFCQLITIPLFKEHKILTQVAGHGSHTIKLIPSLTITDEDCDWIVRAFDDVIADSHRCRRGVVARQDAGAARDARERVQRRLFRTSHARARAARRGFDGGIAVNAASVTGAAGRFRSHSIASRYDPPRFRTMAE